MKTTPPSEITYAMVVGAYGTRLLSAEALEILLSLALDTPPSLKQRLARRGLTSFSEISETGGKGLTSLSEAPTMQRDS